MVAVLVRAGSFASVTAGTTSQAITCGAGSSTPGNQLLAWAYSGTTKANTTVTFVQSPWVLLLEFEGANGYTALYGRIADGSEGVGLGTVSTSVSASHGAHAEEWSGLALNVVATATGGYSTTHTPAAITSGAATASGRGFGFALYYSNGSLAGWSSGGSWSDVTDPVNVRAGGGALTGFAVVAGVTTVSIQPTWTTNRTGHGTLIVLLESVGSGFFDFF